MTANAVNRHLEIPPIWHGSEAGAGDPLAILIPGRAQSPSFMIEVATRLALPDLKCAIIGAYGDSWYPDRFMAPIANNQPSLDHGLERIEALVAEAERRLIPRNRIALIGFSQGACLACEYIHRYPTRWGTFISFTGGLPGPPEQTWNGELGGLAETPMLMTNGDTDPWVPLSRTQQTVEVFRRQGGRVTERVYRGRGHEILDDEIEAARERLMLLIMGNP